MSTTTGVGPTGWNCAGCGEWVPNGVPHQQTLIVGLRAGHPSHTPEAEGVLVETAGGDVRLTLDDGELLILDRQELVAALGVFVHRITPARRAA